MTRIPFIAAAAIALTSDVALAQDKPKDSINDYLVNVGAGHVAANELIGLTGSAVSNLQTPKDLVAALAGLGDSSSRNGFGVAWSPGRSSMKLMGVSAAEYQASDLKRLWASTTFSYAQNSKTIAGANYSQKAATVNVVYYLGKSDPVLTQYLAFSGADGGACGEQSMAFDKAAQDLHKAKADRQKEEKALPVAVLDAIDREFSKDAAALSQGPLPDKVDPMARVRKAQQHKADPSKSESYRAALETGLQQLDKCARDAGKKAAAQWNASHLDFVFGQGWIRGEAAASPRISLGRHVGLALAWGLDDGLLNLTYRRVSGEVDLDTLTKGLAYKGTSLAAMRYTYRMDDRPGKLTYALAEVSNAKADARTTSNSAFKWALGVDRQVGENMWIELRAGRARVPGGTAEENKALLNLKFSPEAGLPNAIKASGS
jgi:hypothetical protein